MTTTSSGPKRRNYDRQATRSMLLAAVSEVEATLREVADEAQRMATLPEPGWRALHESGLFKIKAPMVLGGAEADPVTQIEVFERVAYIDSSAGWTLFVGAGTLGNLSAWLPDEAMDAFLVEGRLPRVAGATAPAGRATPVEGGYRLNGRWSFGSGCNHAEWMAGGAVVEGQTPSVKGFAFPKAAVTIHDNWQVGGLKGTGSNDFSVSDLFVPSWQVFTLAEPARRGGPLYKISAPGFVTNEHAAFALGVGRRALDEVVEVAKTKVRGFLKPQGVAAREVFRHELGRLDVSLRAARAGVLEAYESAWTSVSADEAVSEDQQILMRCTAVHATEVAMKASRFAFRFAGAHSLYDGNVIERCFRDVHAGAQHAMVHDAAFEARGQQLLGLSEASALA